MRRIAIALYVARMLFAINWKGWLGMNDVHVQFVMQIRVDDT